MTSHDRAVARDILDAQEGTGPVRLLDADGVLDVLRRVSRVAIVGASPDAARPSNGVMGALLAAGLDVVPVNPNAAEVLGRRGYPTLENAVREAGPVDIVDVFRRPEHTPAIARSAIAVGARVLVSIQTSVLAGRVRAEPRP